MKQLLIYCSVLAALLILPGGGMDAARLHPVELIWVEQDSEGVGIRTDLGDAGTGDTLEAAFASLEQSAPGKLFLNTADYLIINEQAANLLPELRNVLPGSCRVCIATAGDPGEAALYLRAHSPEYALSGIAGEERLDVLTMDEGMFSLHKKEN